MNDCDPKLDIFEPLLETENPDESTREIIDKINSKNAKRIAVGLIFFFIVYHTYVHFIYGNDSCKWLLSAGRFKGDMGWQPYGCMMHIYTEVDRTGCMKYFQFLKKKNTFIFIGDKRIKELYVTFTKQFSHPEWNPESGNKIISSQLHGRESLDFINDELCLRAYFVYFPFVNTSVHYIIEKWKSLNITPAVIIAGSSPWSIKQGNDTKEYKYNLTHYVRSLEKLCSESNVLWVLQSPVNEDKLNISNAVVNNKVIDEYNEAVIEVLKYSCIQMWSSVRLIAQGYLEDMINGVQQSRKSLETDVQILLNMYCNDYMYFPDGTCCATTEPYTSVQLSTFIAFLLCTVIGFITFIPAFKDRFSITKKTSTLLTSLIKLSLIIGYFYLCDRTGFFMKENKYYSAISFWLPLVYIFTLGIFFNEDSRYTKVLNRDQTDEWKGWMQLSVLIYEMTGAESNPIIYNHIAILVSSYLFLTGYGHFYYMWFRNDAGLIRFLQVLFRLNFFVVILCLAMNRPYQFYYFIPVVSFWFILLYLLFWMPPRVTSTTSDGKPIFYIYLALKLAIFFALVTVLYMSEVFFEKIFVTRPWKALFVTDDDQIRSWWIRWKTDRFSTLYGAIFAFSLVLAQRYNFLDDNNHNNLFPLKVSLLVSLCSLIAIFGVSAHAVLLSNDALQMNEIHPYTVVIPIICYILLRNVSGILRNRYSNFFAFFGKISLELFVGHFHIWLSADGYGVLVLLPRYPVLNALLVSYIFVCISHEMHDITRTLIPYAVPSDWRKAARNAIIFIIFLIPIGFRAGMFW